jgi:hypothetical protein
MTKQHTRDFSAAPHIHLGNQINSYMDQYKKDYPREEINLTNCYTFPRVMGNRTETWVLAVFETKSQAGR